jgi:hypothetical protein
LKTITYFNLKRQRFAGHLLSFLNTNVTGVLEQRTNSGSPKRLDSATCSKRTGREVGGETGNKHKLYFQCGRTKKIALWTVFWASKAALR